MCICRSNAFAFTPNERNELRRLSARACIVLLPCSYRETLSRYYYNVTPDNKNNNMIPWLIGKYSESVSPYLYGLQPVMQLDIESRGERLNLRIFFPKKTILNGFILHYSKRVTKHYYIISSPTPRVKHSFYVDRRDKHISHFVNEISMENIVFTNTAALIAISVRKTYRALFSLDFLYIYYSTPDDRRRLCIVCVIFEIMWSIIY